MTQLSFKICNSCENNNECCCQLDLSYALNWFVENGVNIQLFGVKTGGNLAKGQALAEGAINSLTNDIVTFLDNSQITVVSLCQIHAVKMELTTVDVTDLVDNICNNNKSCCCNGGLSTTLKDYEVGITDTPDTNKEVSIEIADSTANNPQNFYVVKVCSNIALLEFTGGGGSTIISNGYVSGSMTVEGTNPVDVHINNLQGEVNINDQLTPNVPVGDTKTYVILPLCVIASITNPIKKIG